MPAPKKQMYTRLYDTFLAGTAGECALPDGSTQPSLTTIEKTIYSRMYDWYELDVEHAKIKHGWPKEMSAQYVAKFFGIHRHSMRKLLAKLRNSGMAEVSKPQQHRRFQYIPKREPWT